MLLERLLFGSTVADIVTLLGSQAAQVDVSIGVTDIRQYFGKIWPREGDFLHGVHVVFPVNADGMTVPLESIA
jgi:hypothetical protein